MLFLPFAPFISHGPTFEAIQLICYACHLGLSGFALSADAIPTLVLHWSYISFDYDNFKWKERRLFDLSHHQSRLSRLLPIPPPEGASSSWGSFASADCSPMDISAYCSSAFDNSCRLTPDFFDILTMPLVESHTEAFLWLA